MFFGFSYCAPDNNNDDVDAMGQSSEWEDR